MHRLVILALTGLVVGGCGREAPAPVGTDPAPAASPTAAASAPPFRAALDARQLMEWVLLPAVDAIWDSAGTVITAEGRTELHPTTDAGWEAVRNQAAVVAEVGNLLMMPGRAAGDDWLAYAAALTTGGEHALAAAQAQDPDALFDAGGELYLACRGCHERYWIPFAERRPGSVPGEPAP